MLLDTITRAEPGAVAQTVPLFDEKVMFIFMLFFVFRFMCRPLLQDRLRLSEVIHSRLAMLAFGGMVTQAVAVSDKFPYMG